MFLMIFETVFRFFHK